MTNYCAGVLGTTKNTLYLKLKSATQLTQHFPHPLMPLFILTLSTAVASSHITSSQTTNSAIIKQNHSAQIIYVTNNPVLTRIIMYDREVQHVDSYSSHFSAIHHCSGLLSLFPLCHLISFSIVSSIIYAAICYIASYSLSFSVSLVDSLSLCYPLYATTVLNNSKVTTLQLQCYLMILC